MREFARLYADLDETTSTTRKLDALQQYFSRATPENAAQAPAFSSPIARRAPHISRASSTLVTSSMNM